MVMIKCCFFGLGSIGTKHLKNLVQVCSERGLPISIDAFRSSAKKLEKEVAALIDREIYDIDKLPFYDIIFITNPTSFHYETLIKTINKTKHIFIEKPVFESAKYDISLFDLEKDAVYHVACPLRFNPVIDYLKKYIQNKNVFSVRAICSSYLPEWRPGRDYREIYSSIQQMGGGVSLDLIHELDYLTYLFDFPSEIFNIKGKFSNLEIDSDDLSVYILKYQDKVAELHLDYFGRVPVRKLELYLENELITGDLINNKINFLVEKKELNLTPENVLYKEMNYFLDLIITKNNKSFNDIKNACKVLKLSEGKIS